MALLYIEDFSKYASGSTGWIDIGGDNPTIAVNSVNTIDVGTGRFGQNCVKFSDGNQSRNIRFPVDTVTADTTLIAEIWFNTSHGNTSSGAGPRDNLFSVTNATGTEHIEVRLGVGGMIEVAPNSGLSFYAVDAYIAHAWNHIQIKCTLLDAGSVVVKVNDIEVINETGDFRVGTGTSQPLSFIEILGQDDFCLVQQVIIKDTLGGTFDDFGVDFRMEPTIPATNGTTVEWAATGAATNVEAIDDPLGSYDDDTSYLEEVTPGQTNMSNHGTTGASGATTILFAYLSTLVKDNAASPEALSLIVDSGGTINVAPVVQLTTTYQWQSALWSQDPNTSAAWTVANINLAEWGVRAL